MNSYKEIAKQKYELHKKKEDEKNNKIKEEEFRMIAEENKRKETENKIESINESINEIINFIEFDNTIEVLLSNLSIIQNIIQENIQFIKENNMKEIQGNIINIIYILNIHTENIKYNLDDVNSISQIMKDIIKLTELEIDIELMDTSKDEDFARSLV